MRTSPLSLGIAVLLAGAFGCAPATPPAAPTPAPPVSVAPVATAPVAAPIELTPVAEPADVIGVVRWKNPGAMLTTLSGCANMPPQVIDGALHMGIDALANEALRGQLDAKQLAGAVATDAPVDVLVALEQGTRRPRAIAAVAIGLGSLDQAKGALEAVGPLAEVAPGIWRVGGKEARRNPSCVIAASAGATPARLICSDRQKEVEVLAPYLARTLPTLAPAASDLHAELRVAPFDARFGDQLRQQLRGLPVLAQSELTIGERDFDRAVVEAAVAVGEEVKALAGDLDRLTFDLSSAPSACLTLTGALQMKGKASWIAGTMQERVGQAGPPPAIFWRAPKESDAVTYARGGADPARWAGILRTLRTLADGALTKAKAGSEADRKAVTDLIAFPLGKDTNVVQASGHYDAAPTAKLGPDMTPQQVIDAVLNDYVGWYLWGADEGPEALTKTLKNLVAVYGRKGLIDPIRKELRKDARFLPTVKLVTAPAQLGKGALDVEIKVDAAVADEQGPRPKGAKGAKAGKPERVSFALHVLLMPDGKNTWLALGARRDELVKRLLAAKTGAPDAGTLAARAGLDPLKSSQTLSGGFLTIGGFAKGMSAVFASPRLPFQTNDVLKTLNNLPHRGETPIFLTSTVVGGAAPRGELTLAVQKETIEDVGAVIGAAVRAAANAFGGAVPLPSP